VKSAGFPTKEPSNERKKESEEEEKNEDFDGGG